MKFILVFVFILLVLIQAPEVAAAPSFLAMCHKDWNCKATKRLYAGQDEIITGWLENTFAPDCKCADELLSDSRKKVVRIHLINSPCMRNKRCGRYEVLYKETAASASRKVLRGDKRFLAKFDAVLERAARRLEKSKGDLQCYISPCLECDLNERARRHLAVRVSRRLPDCILVDSPHRQRCIPGTVCEKHGNNPDLSRSCIVDLDGTDGATINVQRFARRYRSCDIRYYWEPWMNCNRGSFVDPRRRNCRYGSEMFSYTKGILCQYFYPSSDICSR